MGNISFWALFHLLFTEMIFAVGMYFIFRRGFPCSERVAVFTSLSLSSGNAK